MKNSEKNKKREPEKGSFSGSKKADECVRAYREGSSPLGSYSGVTSAMGVPAPGNVRKKPAPKHFPGRIDPPGSLGAQDMLNFPGRMYLPGTGVPDVPFYGEGKIFVSEDELPVQDADDL